MFFLLLLFDKIIVVIVMKKKIFIIGLISVIVDQISKILISLNFDVNNSVKVISSFFSITYVKNTGAAWGIFSNGTLVLALISIIFLYFFIDFIVKSDKISKINVFSYGLITGGIVGNLIDRLARGYVIDFLDFKIFSYDYPVFNIADTFIVVGIILLIIDSFIKRSE